MTVVEAQRLETYEEIVADHFGSAAQALGYSKDELFAAFRPSRLESAYATLWVDGVPFDSYRHQVGVQYPDDRSRGGFELSDNVTDIKVFTKAAIMDAKHKVASTGNVGGKSGVCATPQQLEDMGSDGRAELFKQHALAHNIHPRTNVVATDIGTWGPDMDAIASALVTKYGTLAGAAASGASERYGGWPKLHAPHTGQGASMVVDAYFRERAETDSRVDEAIGGGRPLRALVQGLGKAGAHFVKHMPPYIALAGALERNGAIVAEDDGALDREQVLRLSDATQLDESAVAEVDGARWLEPTARSEFWATPGVDIVVPAYDQGQFTADDAQRFGGMVVASVANDPVTREAQQILAARHIDELPDAVTNAGGTISSQGLWERYMRPGWTQEGFEADWQRSMLHVAHTMLHRRRQLAAEKGQFVSLADTVNLIAVQRAVERMRQARQQGYGASYA